MALTAHSNSNFAARTNRFAPKRTLSPCKVLLHCYAQDNSLLLLLPITAVQITHEDGLFLIQCFTFSHSIVLMCPPHRACAVAIRVRMVRLRFTLFRGYRPD